MNRPAAAWFAGLLVGASTATAAWVRLAGHPAPSAATRAQLAAIQACIRALEALPTQPRWDDEDADPERSDPQRWGGQLERMDSPYRDSTAFDKGGTLPSGAGTVRNDSGRPEYLRRPDDEDGMPQRRGQDGPLAPLDPATGTPGGSRPSQDRTGPSGAVTSREAATVAADMCPQCHRDNAQPWDLCADCAAGNAQAAAKSYEDWLDADRRECE